MFGSKVSGKLLRMNRRRMNPLHHQTRDFKLKCAHHVVFKCHYRVFSQVQIRQMADSILLKYGEYFRVKIYHRAIVGDHIHLLVLPKSSSGLHGFLRVVTGQLGMRLKRLGITPKGKSLWVFRPWSRVLSWGRDVTTAIHYIALNYLEGQGKLRRTHKQDELKKNAVLIHEVLEKQLTKLTSEHRTIQFSMGFA